jgi:hypothetical protein
MDCLATEGTKIFPGCDMERKPLSPILMVVEMKIPMPLCAFPMPKQT